MISVIIIIIIVVTGLANLLYWSNPQLPQQKKVGAERYFHRPRLLVFSKFGSSLVAVFNLVVAFKSMLITLYTNKMAKQDVGFISVCLCVCGCLSVDQSLQ